MKKTLQDQYLLIKEGKGHKGVFLADAKRDFPQYVPNAATFEEAAASLKTKNIINENIINVMPINYIEPTKKQPYELAFESFLSEAKKKKENEDEKVKAEEKKVSKPVEKDLEKQFDNKDDKNPDNLIFDQIMMGYYAEMKDPKNADKTMQQLKDMVIKNLSKDPIHYTKDGQFGVKGLGYTTEAPGLGEPKEAKGKWKSSGYGDLKESKINEAYEPDINTMDELDLKSKLHSMGVTPIVVNSMLSTKGVEGLRDALKDKLKDRAIGFKESKEIDSFISNVKKAFTEKPDKKFTPEEIEAKLNQLYPGRAERKKDNSPEETKLREIIREMVDAELGEASQMTTIINPNKKGEGDIYIPQFYILPPEARKKLNLLNPGENSPAYNESFLIPHFKMLPGNNIGFSNWLVQAIENPKDIKNPLNGIINSLSRSNEDFKNFLTYTKKFISTNKVIIPTRGKDAIYYELTFPEGFEVLPLKEWTERELEKSYEKLAKAESGEVRRGRPINIASLKKFIQRLENLSLNSEGGVVVVLPPFFTESLMEGVEKELAAINKEAEHEILQSKLNKVQDLINKKQSQISKLDEDEDMKALTDAKKVKEIEKDIKALEKAKSKIDKMMGKHKGKKKEVIDEMDNSEDMVEDIAPEYIEDAEQRLRDGESIDSIIGNYPNLSLDERNHLKNFLSWQQDSDIGQGEELDTEEEY